MEENRYTEGWVLCETSSKEEPFKTSLRAEYIELIERLDKLERCLDKDSNMMIRPYEAQLLFEQYKYMREYYYVLHQRCIYYNIIYSKYPMPEPMCYISERQ